MCNKQVNPLITLDLYLHVLRCAILMHIEPCILLYVIHDWNVLCDRLLTGWRVGSLTGGGFFDAEAATATVTGSLTQNSPSEKFFPKFLKIFRAATFVDNAYPRLTEFGQAAYSIKELAKPTHLANSGDRSDENAHLIYSTDRITQQCFFCSVLSTFYISVTFISNMDISCGSQLYAARSNTG